jgi:hypothetical protein
MPQVVIGSRPIAVGQLIALVKLCDPEKQVIFGPGYMGPKLEFEPIRFDYGVALAFGIYSRDHHPELRVKKYLVPEIKVSQFLEFLNTIPGSEREGWKGGTISFNFDTPVHIGLFGEVPMGVVGVYEGSFSVTIMSVADLR